MPLYRFSRYNKASGSREVRGTGGYSQPVRVGPGGIVGGRRLYLRDPGGGGGTLTDPSPTPQLVTAPLGQQDGGWVIHFDVVVGSRSSPSSYCL